MCEFSRAWHRLNVFPRLELVVRFPAFGTGRMSSHVWHRRVFSRVFHWPHVCDSSSGLFSFAVIGQADEITLVLVLRLQ